MRRARPDEHGTRGVDVVRPREGERQAGERRTAPAARRAAGMRADRGLDQARDRGRDACGHRRQRIRRGLRPPVEDEVGCAGIEPLPALAVHGRGGDEHAAPRPGRRRTHEGHALDVREPLVLGRRLQLAEQAHLRGRREHAGTLARQLRQVLGRRQRPDDVEQSLDDVDLGLRERRVEPDAAHRDAVPARRVDDVAPRRAGDVRVVEHDPTLTRGQLRVERVGEVAQRARALVAVEAAVPAGDVLLGEAGLPRPGDAHHEHDVPVARRRRSGARPRTSERGQVLGGELEGRRARS